MLQRVARESMSTSFSSAKTRRIRHCCSVMSCSRRWGRKRCMTASRALIKSIGRERPKDRIGTATAAPLSSELNRSAFAAAVFFVNDAMLLTNEPRFEFRRNDVLIKEGYHNRTAAGSVQLISGKIRLNLASSPGPRWLKMPRSSRVHLCAVLGYARGTLLHHPCTQPSIEAEASGSCDDQCRVDGDVRQDELSPAVSPVKRRVMHQKKCRQ